MFNVRQKILNLTDQLYPTGRAFNIPKGGPKEKLINGLSFSEERAYNDSVSILDSILPDNDNFTVDDATDWEGRLGMIVGLSASLSDRKLAITRKMNHPGDITARQSHDYLQKSLQDAGFNVFVHENLLEQSVIVVLALPSGLKKLGQSRLNLFKLGNVVDNYSSLFNDLQLGQSQLGGASQLSGKTFKNLLVNHVDETLDENFNIGGDLRSTFFIGGPVLGNLATVPIGRKEEFRQIILKIKPIQSVGFLLIDYI